ncbi:hypothetical protein HKD37_16G045752 [Glycine soja]
MTEDRLQRMTLEDYSSPIIPQYFTSIARPEVLAANISYPYSLIQLIQGNPFHDLPSEDPYAHLATYIDICNMVKIARVPEDVINLSLFCFFLKYFPESKTAEGKMKISSFHQFPDKSLSEALDHFHGLLKKTPTHGYSEPVQLNIFIDGLQPQSKQLLDASAGGKIKLKTPEEAMELIENMTASDHAILRDHTYAPTKRSLLELTTQDATLAQNKLLSQQIEALIETLSKLLQQLQAVSPSHSSAMQVGGCHICGGAHESEQCIGQEDSSREVKYMGGSSWRSHLGNQYNKEHKSQSPYQHPSQGPSHQAKPTNIEELLIQFMQETKSNLKSTDTTIRNLEVQIGQLAQEKAERPTRTFRANTEKNPKEECQTVLTRSHERAQEEGEAEED